MSGMQNLNSDLEKAQGGGFLPLNNGISPMHRRRKKLREQKKKGIRMSTDELYGSSSRVDEPRIDIGAYLPIGI